MREIQVSEAKAQILQLLDDVELGERVLPRKPRGYLNIDATNTTLIRE
jgi:hypothetical protein